MLNISDYRLGITSSFTGAPIILFGALKTRSPDFDIIIIIKGPNEKAIVRKKNRVANIWINTESIIFKDTPSYYKVLSTKPLEQITTLKTRNFHKIGLDYIQPKIESASREFTPSEILDFQEAMIQVRIRQKIYREDNQSISITGNIAFRSEVYFPANVPVGNYSAEVFLVQDKKIVSAQTTPLFVNKTGIERTISNFAQNFALSYGIAIVVLASIIGLSVAQIFYRLK